MTLILGILVSSILFGFPLHNNPAIHGKVIDAVSGKPIPDALVEYNFSQGKGLANKTRAALTAEDGTYRIPFVIFPSYGFYGKNSVSIYHPLYATKGFEEGEFTIIRSPKVSRTINIELVRLKDKYKESAVVGISSLERELEYNPRWYNTDIKKFGLTPKLDRGMVEKEIEELSEKHKILIRPDNTPSLIDVLQNSKYPTARAKAAEALAKQKKQEALFYLQDCIGKDTDSNARWQCRKSYWDITGKVPPVFHVNDVANLFERFNDSETVEYYNKLDHANPDRAFFLEMKRVFEEVHGQKQ